jgi:hypothetical protein
MYEGLGEVTCVAGIAPYIKGTGRPGRVKHDPGLWAVTGRGQLLG